MIGALFDILKAHTGRVPTPTRVDHANAVVRASDLRLATCTPDEFARVVRNADDLLAAGVQDDVAAVYATAREGHVRDVIGAHV